MTSITLPNGRTFNVVNGLEPARRDDASHPSPASSTKRRNKYNAQSVVVNGVRFASKAEAERDAELQLLQRAGQVFNVKRQPRYPLIVNGVKVCTYVGDWRYFVKAAGHPNGLEVVEDRKGALTPAFKIKWALAKALHSEIEWRLS